MSKLGWNIAVLLLVPTLLLILLGFEPAGYFLGVLFLLPWLLK